MPADDSSVERDARFASNLRHLLEEAASGQRDVVPWLPARMRIVGEMARVAAPPEFPECVAVGWRASGVDRFCCTGVLVGKNVVLTAGHCGVPCDMVLPATPVVFVGTDVRGTGPVRTGRAVIHPAFASPTAMNDLMVIVLDEDVVGVTPAVLADGAQIDAARALRAVGYGATDAGGSTGYGTRRFVDIPVASSGCSRSGDGARWGCAARTELVAAGLGSDTCRGDSGGPVYLLVDGSWRLAGITSRATKRPPGATGAVCGDGGIYTRVDAYVEFIRSAPGGHY